MFEDARPEDHWKNDIEALRRRIDELEQSNHRLSHAQKQLRDREGRLRKLLVNIPGMVYKGRSDWSSEVISQSTLVCGYTPEEFLRQEANWLEIIHPSDRDDVLQESTGLVQEPKSITQRYRIRHKNGEVRWVEDHKASFFDEEGTFLGVDGIVFDVTDYVVTERALCESEARFRSIFENAADGFLVADVDTGQFSMANDALCRMIGHSQETIRRLNVHDIHPAEALAEVLETFAKQARGELRLSHNIPVKTKDGRIVYCDINAIPLRMHGKKYVLGVFRDVTEQRMLSEQLRESEGLYRTLVESAGESIARVNAEGQFLFMNRTAAHRLGGEPQDYVGKTMWGLFPPEIADRQVASVRNVIKTGCGVNVIVPTVVGGETRWYNTTVEPLANAEGDITSALIIGRDIHDLREAQKKLEEYRAQMARAEQLASLGTLSATVAHELNQPLTVLQLTVQNCLAELEKNEAGPQMMADLKDCLQEISTASVIVGRFKEFARYSRSRDLTWVSLENIAGKVIRVWGEAAEESGLSVVTRGLEQLPNLYMDERNVEQLFFSLVENAVQAADGEGDRRLLITAKVGGASVELHFVDDCGGIAPEHLDRIFEPFFTTKAGKRGTGLGLCVVEDIVQSAAGKITVDNRPGEGVTFVVTLPVADTNVRR